MGILCRQGLAAFSSREENALFLKDPSILKGHDTCILSNCILWQTFCSRQENNRNLHEYAMKISNDTLRVLQDAELKKSSGTQAQPGDFSELLSKQLESGRTAQAAEGNASVHGFGRAYPLNSVVENVAARPLGAVGEAAAQMDGMFNSLESYAQQIAGGGQEGLKQAYGLLQDVNGQIAGFKQAYPNAKEDMPEIASLLNDLDVLATTETFKFNRGDYL